MKALVHFGSSGFRSSKFALRLRSLAVVGALATSAGLVASAPLPSVVEVEAGDTFSSIASRFTDRPGGWRKLYRANLSGLANPNVISIGMRFALASDAKGERYLRLLAPGQASAGDAMARGANAARTVAPAPAPAPAPAAIPAVAATESAPSSTAPAAAASNTLVIGVLPNIPAATLGTHYERMTRYLERGNVHKVTIVIPRNFKEFFDSTMRGEYDLAVAAPHFARVAQVDRNMIPLVTYQPQINALFVAPIDSKLKGPADVRERVVAFANVQSLVAMYGLQWLKQAGLEAGTDYEVRAARTDLGVGRMLLSGDAVAAIMSNGEFRALPADESARLKVVEVFAKIPNFVVLAHPRIESARLGRIKAQLKAFLADPEEGVPFSQASGFSALVDVDPAVMRELDSFTSATRRSMGYGN